MNTTSMQINWKNISENPSDKAIDLIEKNMNKIDWEALSSNTSHRAISILENNLDKIHWGRLSSNESAISLIEKYFADHKSTITLSNTIFCKSTLYWFNVCRNPGVINFLEKIMDNQPRIIDWKGLSMNKAAIHILEKNMDKVNWEYLSYNPKAIHILEQNMDKIDWVAVSCNRVFFKEYPTIKLKRLLNII